MPITFASVIALSVTMSGCDATDPVPRDWVLELITASAHHSDLESQNAGESVPAGATTFASVIALSVTMVAVRCY